MREQIERVIAELVKQRDVATAKQKTTDGHFAFKYWGMEVGLESAIAELKAVLNEHETNHTRQTSSSGENDPTK